MKVLMTLKKNEKGNALFLILIAVALFAALSYAITQSGRGGGSIDREQALITASQVTQYAAGLRTTITRMIITGTAVTAVDFTDDTTDDDDEVFDAAGGGAIEQDPPSSSQTSATPYDYLVPTTSASGHYMAGIGTNAPEVILLARNLTTNVCTEIRRGLGLPTTIPPQVTANFDHTTPGAIGNATTINGESGEAFTCVYTDTGSTIRAYAHALVEQ